MKLTMNKLILVMLTLLFIPVALAVDLNDTNIESTQLNLTINITNTFYAASVVANSTSPYGIQFLNASNTPTTNQAYWYRLLTPNTNAVINTTITQVPFATSVSDTEWYLSNGFPSAVNITIYDFDDAKLSWNNGTIEQARYTGNLTLEFQSGDILVVGNPSPENQAVSGWLASFAIIGGLFGILIIALLGALVMQFFRGNLQVKELAPAGYLIVSAAIIFVMGSIIVVYMITRTGI